MSKSNENSGDAGDAWDALSEMGGGNTVRNTAAFENRFDRLFRAYWRTFEEYPMPPVEESCVEAMQKTEEGRKQLALRCAKIVRMVLLKDFDRYLADPRCRDMCAEAYAEVVRAVDTWEPGHNTQLTTWVYRKVYHSMARSARKDYRDDCFNAPQSNFYWSWDDDEASEEHHQKLFDDRGPCLEEFGSAERAMTWRVEYETLRDRLLEEEQKLLDMLLAGYNSVEIGRLRGVSQSKAYRDVTKLLTKIREKIS